MNQPQITDLQFIPKVNKEDFEVFLKEYEHYLKGHWWVRIPVILMIIVIAGYNFFVAGKSYTIAESNNIKNTMVVILSFIVLGLLIAGVMMFKRQRALRKKVKEMAQSHNFSYKEFKKEVNLVLKSFYGGRGI
ncbi:hypothetical protein [Sinomicrobium sp. M5D2P9]